MRKQTKDTKLRNPLSYQVSKSCYKPSWIYLNQTWCVLVYWNFTQQSSFKFYLYVLVRFYVAHTVTVKRHFHWKGLQNFQRITSFLKSQQIFFSQTWWYFQVMISTVSPLGIPNFVLLCWTVRSKKQFEISSFTLFSPILIHVLGTLNQTHYVLASWNLTQ